ncbi:MAG: hypothetical protein HKO77_01050 [Gemmatimonadetes bacterium]|nr:hypothetical protein [Gemmatimonadota bacterium]NNL29572.1 hypothetical protein [Gemmatimonadota bacterium]
MWNDTRQRIAVAAVVALAASGCGVTDVPEVGPDFDAEAAMADYEAMEMAMASDDLSAFQALGGRTPFGSSPAAIDAMADFTTRGETDDSRAFVLGFARQLMAAASSRVDGPALGPIISGWHRGTTFVYDAETDEYQPDLTLEGAPETGVRFILYEVDAEGTPIVEEEVGYADLIDEGDGSVEDIVLRLSVVVGDETLIDYRTTLDHDATSGALTVDGFFVGDEVRLDFDVGIAFSNAGGVEQGELDFEIGVVDRDFSIVGNVSGIEENDDGVGSVNLSVRHRAHELVVDMTGEQGELDGTVFIDGDAFATISGPEEDPVIANPDGGPLTASELRVLHRVVHVVEDVFQLLEDLLDPVDEIVLLGFIL